MAEQSRLEIVVDSRGAERNLRNVRSELQGVERTGVASMSSLRSAALAAAGAFAAIGVSVGVGSAIRQVADFEASINGLSAVSGAVGQDLATLENQARTLGATSQFSAQQAAEGQRFLAQAGFEVNEILGATPGILQLATAAQIDLASAADIASNVLGGMGLEVSELARVNDVLAATASSSNTNITQLGDALSYAAPFARAANVSIEEAAAAIGVMSDAGIQGSRAGTGLLGVIRQLSNVTPAAEEALSAAGLSIADVNIEARGLQPVLMSLRGANLDSASAIKIFGSEAGAAAQVLVSDYQGAITGAEGESQRMADTLERGLSPAFKSLGSAVSEATLQMGDSGLASALESAVRGATGVISVWNGMGDEFRDANGVTQDYMDTVEATGTAIEAVAIFAGGRLVAALASATAGMVTATSAATALRTAMAFLGGPVGILVGAGGLLYAFREELGLIPEPAASVAKQVDEISTSMDGLSNAMLDVQVAAFGAELVQIGLQAERLETRIKSLKEAANDPASFGQGQQGDLNEGVARAEAELEGLRNREEALNRSFESLDRFRSASDEAGEASEKAGNSLNQLSETADSVVAKFRPMLNQDIQSILDRAGPGSTIDDGGQIRDAWGNAIPTLQRELDAQLKEQLNAFRSEQNLQAGLQSAAQAFITEAESAAKNAFANLVTTGDQDSVPGRAGAHSSGSLSSITPMSAEEVARRQAAGEEGDSPKLMATKSQSSAPGRAGKPMGTFTIRVQKEGEGDTEGTVQGDEDFIRRMASALGGVASAV